MLPPARRLLRAAAVLVALAAVLTLPRTAGTEGTTFFVSPAGNDANAGTEAKPWKTLAKAAATLRAGETVQVRAGRYRERFTVRSAGQPGAWITFAARAGEEVVIDGTGVAVEKDEGLFELAGASWVKISGFRIVNSAQAGILANDSAHLVIEKNRTEKTGSSGIGIWGCQEVLIDGNEVALACSGEWQEALTVAGTKDFEVRDNHVHNGPPEYKKEGICIKDGSSEGRVHGNHVHHVTSVGIYVDAWDKRTCALEVFGNKVHDVRTGNGIALASEMGGWLEGVRIANNVSWNNGFCGIAVTTNGTAKKHPMKDLWIVNNTVYGNGRGEWGGGIIVDDPDLVFALVRNNLCSRNLTFEIAVGEALQPGALKLDHNLLEARHEDPGERPGDAAVFGDPRLVDPAAGDFRLRAGSPAIDAGSPDEAPPDDHDGKPRPKGAGIDIGAFES